jgi:hypothetical protein
MPCGWLPAAKKTVEHELTMPFAQQFVSWTSAVLTPGMPVKRLNRGKE